MGIKVIKIDRTIRCLMAFKSCGLIFGYKSMKSSGRQIAAFKGEQSRDFELRAL